MYGILISLGILVAALSAEKLAFEKKLKIDFLWNSLFWAIVVGILCARIYHVISLWEYYSLNIAEIFKIWEGGLGIWGGIFGGVGFFILFAKIKKEPLLKWLDVAGVCLPLAQAIGRIGNFFNQELYGPPTKLPWGIYIKPENRLPKVALFDKFHPLFLYESLLNLVLFGILYKLAKKNPRKGTLFLGYLIGYGSIRFLLEPLRLETWKISGLNVSQTISILVVLIGILCLFTLHRTTGDLN